MAGSGYIEVGGNLSPQQLIWASRIFRVHTQGFADETLRTRNEHLGNKLLLGVVEERNFVIEPPFSMMKDCLDHVIWGLGGLFPEGMAAPFIEKVSFLAAQDVQSFSAAVGMRYSICSFFFDSNTPGYLRIALLDVRPKENDCFRVGFVGVCAAIPRDFWSRDPDDE